ncbi:MAG: TIGR01548 family HAD-type hydrolase [Planctomycetes bacterium]|nr:TIGR01548 family HAD-type hydrolase [Planctomycetota bacterium]
MSDRAPTGPLPRPLPRIAGLGGYRRPPLPACVDLRLDGNEGAAPAAALCAALADLDPELLRRYPSAAALTETIAARHGVEPERVLVLAGGDEVIDRAFRAFTDPSRNAVWPEPSFEMLPRYAEIAGCEARNPPWLDGPFPTAAVTAACDAATGLVFVVTPNNPTGVCATAADLAAVCAAAPHALVVLDHAYVEFADEDLTATALRAHPNVVVIRTLSKARGLAGLRVGYALGDPAVLAALRAVGGPFSVAAPSLALAARALADDAPLRASIARVRAERTVLAERLVARGLAVPGSQANFVLARGPRAVWLADALRGLGIAVRAFPGRALLADAVRITCPGDAADLDRLCSGIDAALAPQALLFDLDGVLADVSTSYRRAIVETAATFGVAVTHDAIRELKMRGAANNDWVLTRELCAAAGVDVDLPTVTARFEELYQGTARPGSHARPGLCETERPLVDAATWRALAERLPLGVVTGRPRPDAERFLARHGLLDRVATLVCMGDTPPKPDPAPVRRALTGLGVARAWLLGDTRDDLDAARGAGVVPLAMPAPGEPAPAATAHLLACGAARVVTSPADLLELLP